ncbi:MAG: hypothetical protein WBP16_01845, partial [Ferruginibacter sp.]
MLALLFIYILPASTLLFVVLLLGWAAAWGILFKKNRHKISFFLFLLLLIISTWGILQLNPVQNWLVTKVSQSLSKNLKTKVTVKHVNFGLFNKLLAEGVLVEDRKKDTLLYAGTVKVNITDWFFFKDHPTLNYVGLSDAVIYMNRTDSVWNYQFLVDYFSSPKPKNNTEKGSIQIDLKILDLKNIVFTKADGWVGQDLKGSVKKLYLTADDINVKDRKIAIGQINMEEPVFAIYDYTGKRPLPELKPKPAVNISDSAQLQWNAGGWEIKVAKITLKNGSFFNDRETNRGPYTDRFDGQHFVFSSINGELSNVLFANDTITTNIKLSTREKSGFEVKELLANMKLTPAMMEFNNLDITTNKSRIGNYYAMKYKDFNTNMADFLHSVNLEGRFDNSNIHSDDLAFFAPELKSWNRIIFFDGNAKGSIDNLTADKFRLKSDNTIITGDISLKGLPDIYNTFIDFKSDDLQTNY